MRVLIDTNVALTYLSGREDAFSKETDVIMRECAEEKIEGAIAFHTANVRDFKEVSIIPALSPKEFLELED